MQSHDLARKLLQTLHLVHIMSQQASSKIHARLTTEDWTKQQRLTRWRLLIWPTAQAPISICILGTPIVFLPFSQALISIV